MVSVTPLYNGGGNHNTADWELCWDNSSLAEFVKTDEPSPKLNEEVDFKGFEELKEKTENICES